MNGHTFPLRRARGFSIVSAIFLLVVLAGLGAAMLNVATVQHTESALDVQGARAYQAARAGVEWGLYQQLQAAPAVDCFAASTFAPPAGTSLSGFTVSVSCTRTAGPGALVRRQISAIACISARGVCPDPSQSSDYVQRRLQVEF